ncbi:hypothetical protein COOONC_18409 [Cooperia oncophora]
MYNESECQTLLFDIFYKWNAFNVCNYGDQLHNVTQKPVVLMRKPAKGLLVSCCKHCPIYQYMSGCVNLTPWQMADIEVSCTN